VEADAEAGIAFIILKTVIAEDESGARTMGDWTIRETRMKVEQLRSGSGHMGWTVTWKGRGWHGDLREYLDFFERAMVRVRGSGIQVVPSVKYHLPIGDEPFAEGEYRHTTQALLKVWSGNGGEGSMPIEKDFSPTLAGDDRARQRATILRWLAEVPGQIERAAPGKTRVGVKLMNALFDDDFQVEMTVAATKAVPAFLVAYNRLFDPSHKVAYGGYDLSERNLRVLDKFRATHGKLSLPLSATGNICSGRVMLEYALRGAENGQLHTFFQLPLSAYTASGGNRAARALHSLMLHPHHGMVAWIWHLEESGALSPREGNLHYLDIAEGLGAR
jgi:hypothetical protein